jgi:uncharacterized protein YutE (UPF0331/DUF86 family)
VTDRLLVLRKLTVLREHAARVQRRLPTQRAAFEHDVDCQDATAMSLFVAIQEAVDIALHLASDEGWGVPGSYGEAFHLLAAHGVLSETLAQALSAMAGLRNRIAHGYASVDPARLWSEVPAGLAALEDYCRAVASLAAGGLPEPG